jgi:hypothetical protein
MGFKKTIRVFKILVIWLWMAGLIFSLCGCTHQKKRDIDAIVFPKDIEKIVIYGFRGTGAKGDEPVVLRSPISGAVFTASPIPEEAVHEMTTELFQRFSDKGYNLVSPNQARGVYLNIIARDLGYDDLETLIKIGNAFSADAVLIGYLYRWREREGSDFGVTSPASVAFELYLIRPYDGAILWKGRFDKTQRSLSENILDVQTFLKSGGKWLRAKRLALLGLEGLLDELFTLMEKKET